MLAIGLLWREVGEQLWSRSGTAWLTPEVPWLCAAVSGAAQGRPGMAAPLPQRRHLLEGCASSLFSSLSRLTCVQVLGGDACFRGWLAFVLLLSKLKPFSLVLLV